MDALALAAEAVSEARAWLLDCGAPGVRGMSDAQALYAAVRNVDGGWRTFAEFGPDWDAQALHAALCERYGPALAGRLARL